MQRAYFIDRLRVLLNALVVFHHTAITYGAPGGWYYREQPTTLSLSGVLLILFVSIDQAYIVHAPVLVAIALLLRGWDGPALAKMAVTGSLACLLSLGVASAALMLPGARRVL